jgi:SAM-dependent methyltransferase
MTRQPNFNVIARPYRWLEYLTLGCALERCRLHFLPRLLDCRHALVLGDGDGRFLARLYAANPTLRAIAVDTSSTMLELLRRRCETAAFAARTGLRTCNYSALEHATSSQTDLVVAHFFFDCLTQSELDALIARIAKHARPDALWLISDFRIPSGPMRLPALILVRALYLAFRTLTGLRTTHLPNHATPLRDAGLTRIDHHYSFAGLLTTELWQLQSSLPLHSPPFNH